MKKLLMAGVASALLAVGAMSPASAEYLKEHRGGTMRIVAGSAAGTVDPHINYTLQYWQVFQSLHDGLIGFQKAAGAEGLGRGASGRHRLSGRAAGADEAPYSDKFG